MAKIRTKYPKAGIIFNPISGGGRSAGFSARLASVLQAEGVQVEVQTSRSTYEDHTLADWLSGLAILFVCGGDGTLRKLLPLLAESALPWYMLPSGHESLAARSLSMSNNPEQILQDLATYSPQPHFFSTLDKEPFFSMASVGFDARVIRSIGTRKGTSSNLLYVKNILRSIATYRGAALTVSSSSEQILQLHYGYCLVSNNYRYARGISFTPQADSRNDSEIHLAWSERANWYFLSRVLLALLFKQNKLLPEVHRTVVNEISLALSKPYPVQCDGDPVDIAVDSPVTIKKYPKPMFPLVPEDN